MAEETEKKGEIIEANTTIYVLQQRIDLLEKEVEQYKTKIKALSKKCEDEKTRYVTRICQRSVGRHASTQPEAAEGRGGGQDEGGGREPQEQGAAGGLSAQVQ